MTTSTPLPAYHLDARPHVGGACLEILLHVKVQPPGRGYAAWYTAAVSNMAEDQGETLYTDGSAKLLGEGRVAEGRFDGEPQWLVDALNAVATQDDVREALAMLGRDAA